MGMRFERRNWKKLWLPAILCLLLLISEIYLFSGNNFLFRHKHNDLTQLAMLVSAQNQVLHKNEGTLVWRNPEEGSALFREDAIATMADSQAVIAFADKSELIVEPNSLVVLEMAPAMGGAVPGSGSQIVTRLIKGSMKRKSAGPSKILVKLSSDPGAEAAELDDPHGSAVFRLVHEAEGLRIIIEGGTLVVNGTRSLKESESATLAMGALRLPPPRLKKPSVETKFSKPRRKDDQTLLRIFWETLVPSARAEDESDDEGAIEVTIHFDWDPVPDAQSYLIQIAKDPGFSDVILEKKVSGTDFVYEFQSPNERMNFYFRAAAISSPDVVGKFSDAQHVEVQPKKIVPATTPRRERKVAEPKTPRPPKRPKPAPPPPAPAPAVAAVTPESASESPTHGDGALGAVMHRREFKNGTQMPSSARGSGFVPANLRVEARFPLGESHALTLGGSYLFEVAKPQDLSADAPKLATPLWRAWFLYGLRSDSLQASFGPYATSSSAFRFSGLTAVSETKTLLGALGRLSPLPETSVAFFWNAQLAYLAAGTSGVDLALSLRQPLRNFGTLQAFRLADDRGFFWRIEAQGRFSKIESSQGGLIEIGHPF